MNVERYIGSYLASFDRVKRVHHFQGLTALPRMEDVAVLIKSLMELLFPGRAKDSCCETLECVIKAEMERFSSILEEEALLALLYEGLSQEEAKNRVEEIVDIVLTELPNIRTLIKKDAEAGFKGDPAARSQHEIILCYPALKVLAVHRLAHLLFTQNLPLVPRMMNELMHRETGIDIHPGAQIGESFFIDHGTGVVIGETTVIGNNVKIYQGVTLGALSFPKDGCGMLLKGAKRHPTIGNNVTIYANATILGDITIGDNTTIGSSTWIKTSIPANSRVMIPDPEIIITERIKRQPS